ncbi:MAG: phosphoenolpyruvate protein kinase [Calditrichaeota bacterium]|nr:MAG: phosphoenolpyruvate protein kinase [Calditrichota bacterium]
MKEWLKIACEPAVVIRALKYALVVGLLLIAINYWDVILEGKVTGESLVKMGLTVVVPYLVSTSSSVGALRQSRRQESDES